MFYDDAVCQLASILGRAAGMERWVDVQRFVAEHEATRVDAERGTILEGSGKRYETPAVSPQQEATP